MVITDLDQGDWGDDELTAIDVSPALLLERANWNKFYNDKGFLGNYPFLLYMNEEAEVLNERLLSEVNRTQTLEGCFKLQVDLFTRFIDVEGEVLGAVWLLVSGMKSIALDLKDDLVWLFQSGATEWLDHSYTSHNEEPNILWLTSEERGRWLLPFSGKEPPKANREQADIILVASLEKR